ncbi:hypothetical protein chiPu_0033684, partial [Chiloscyllium punctatum]|nr:hypothetical protein [Chiloscyllium punctatum]
DLGTVICRGAVSRDLDIVVKARLRISQADSGQGVRKRREDPKHVEPVRIGDAAKRCTTRKIADGNRHMLRNECIDHSHIVRSRSTQTSRIPGIVNGVVPSVQQE